MPGGDDDPLTRAVIGAAFNVANTLGHGFLEAVYRRAMLAELEFRNLLAREEVQFPVAYRGRSVGTYVCDLLVENTLIVEIKALGALTDSHLAQTLNYLKASGIRQGLLLNFGTPRLGVRRVRL